MKFDNLQGQTTLNVSSEHFNKVEEDINRELKKEDETEVGKTTIAELAIAVGLKTDSDDAESQENTKAVKLGSLDNNNVLRTLIERRYPEADVDILKEKIEGLLEGGMRQLSENIDENTSLHYQEYLS